MREEEIFINTETIKLKDADELLNKFGHCILEKEAIKRTIQGQFNFRFTYYIYRRRKINDELFHLEIIGKLTGKTAEKMLASCDKHKGIYYNGSSTGGKHWRTASTIRPTST